MLLLVFGISYDGVSVGVRGVVIVLVIVVVVIDVCVILLMMLLLSLLLLLFMWLLLFLCLSVCIVGIPFVVNVVSGSDVGVCHVVRGVRYRGRVVLRGVGRIHHV